MIIIFICGGLGNQMFQYVFSLNYMLFGIQTKYDLSSFSRRKKHNGYELTAVFKNVKIEQATKRDIFYFLQARIIEGEKEYSLLPGKKIIQETKEQEFSYNPSLANLDDAYFNGYWQNQNYFKQNEKEVRQAFTFPKITNEDKQNFSLLQQITSSNSVSIHIRRGDYLQSPIHLNLDIDYYQKAIEIIYQKIANPVFFIFSDDVDWAKKNLQLTNAVFVTNNTGTNSYKDMQLMSYCKNNIIANSTFSWWGAWLNDKKGKIVIAPEKWFTFDVDLSGLLLASWIKI